MNNELIKYSEETDLGYQLFPLQSPQLIRFGGETSEISLMKEEWKKYCKYQHIIKSHAINTLNTLNNCITSNDYIDNEEVNDTVIFELKRFIVIQMI